MPNQGNPDLHSRVKTILLWAGIVLLNLGIVSLIGYRFLYDASTDKYGQTHNQEFLSQWLLWSWLAAILGAIAFILSFVWRPMIRGIAGVRANAERQRKLA